MKLTLQKFKKFLERHSNVAYLNANDDIEFCFCQEISCEECVLIDDCADGPISHMPPFVTREELNGFKIKFPEYFV